VPVRVGIVNDLKLAAEVLRKVVAEDPGLEVLWIARDGHEAIAQCARALPDIVLMDLVMPNLNGVEATRRIMQATPCPILVVTATVSGNIDMVYDAMAAGAIDVTTTPVIGDQRALDSGQVLRRKIHTLWSIARGTAPPAVGASAEAARADKPDVLAPRLPPVLAIGASTGGPGALATILGGLEQDFPAAIVIVQHIDAEFVAGLARWLGSSTRLPVALARHGETVQAGKVLIADAGAHLELAPHGVLLSVATPLDALHRPSVDVFFASVARHAPARSAGLLLTGMGRDGAAGLLSIRQAGFQTFAQDAASSVVNGMPGAAVELGAACGIIPLDHIATQLNSIFKPLVTS
jgi:two-component system response regulator WspF